MRHLVFAALLLAGCVPQQPSGPSGRSLFEANCAACHGAAGRGDGPAAAGLPKVPADLSRIAARRGGAFPMAEVMSTINGYFRPDDSVMPHFGVVDEISGGAKVMLDTGDGIASPAPEGLVALADYLKTLQRP